MATVSLNLRGSQVVAWPCHPSWMAHTLMTTLVSISFNFQRRWCALCVRETGDIFDRKARELFLETGILKPEFLQFSCHICHDSRSQFKVTSSREILYPILFTSIFFTNSDQVMKLYSYYHKHLLITSPEKDHHSKHRKIALTKPWVPPFPMWILMHQPSGTPKTTRNLAVLAMLQQEMVMLSGFAIHTPETRGLGFRPSEKVATKTLESSQRWELLSSSCFLTL